MAAPHIFGNDLPESIDTDLEQGPSPAVKVVSIALAVTITGGLLIGFLIWRGWHEKTAGVAHTEEAKPAPVGLPIKVQILMDEPVRDGAEAVIGGTIRNISKERISGLSVEMQLFHRTDQETEVRAIELNPSDLAPAQEGKYSLTLTGDYRSIKLLRIKSGAAGEAIGFQAAPGARRPLPQPETKTIVVERPSTPRKGEEFINTPDNPSKIP
ncbi:MAG: hypothetical protein QOJ64_2412 [Acidobacteriota bacterium]|jgi:hypothetical protein|nr:hypothetical protein [Acidobacteriota bacterium]